MNFLILLVALVVVLASVSAAKFDSGVQYHVNCQTVAGSRGCQLLPEKLATADSRAYGTYLDEVNQDGWGKLWVHGDATVEGWYQAGYLEGSLTATRIYQHFISWYNYQFGANPLTDETIKFMKDQYAFAKNLATTSTTDPYIVQLNKLLTQFEGILAGQNAAAEEGQKLSELDLLLLVASGDLYDIVPATNPTEFKLRIGELPFQEFHDRWHNQISCSALISIVGNNEDVVAGHTTWTSYQNMLRTYKNYDLDGGLTSTSFSSKPGFVYSKDDFYVIPRTKLVVMETTNGVMNKELYKLVTPESLLTWQRLPIVNALATNGKEWTDMVARYNSGTYANQWMVLDMKQFTPGVGPAKENFLWIAEQAPGVSVATDVTSVITSKGYWPSYNVPYTKSVYVITGFQQAYETYGDAYSYSNCTRGQMFTRDAPKVTNLDGLKSILRYNDYTTDPLSNGNPANAIAARYDIRSENPKSYGAVDAKVTSYARVMNNLQKGEGLASAECGPTHDDISPFVWSSSAFNNQVHVGQPDSFDFSFVEMDFNAH